MSEVARRITRRALLSNAALGLSAMAVTQGVLGGTALASGPPTKQQIAAAKKNWPPAKPVTDAPLTAEEKNLAQLLSGKAKHAMALAAANPTEKFHPGSMPAVGAAFFSRVGAKRAGRAKARAAKLLKTDAATQTLNFGVYAKGTVASAKVAPAVDVQLTSLLRDIVKKEKAKGKPKEQVAPKYRRIEFQLNSVDCIVATKGEWESDEFLLGGHLIEPDGRIVQIKQWMVNDDFDAGETTPYDYSLCKGVGNKINPTSSYLELAGYCPNGGPGDLYRGRKLAGSSLGNGSYTIVMVAGEQDGAGGFGDMLSEVYKSLKGEIDAAITAAGGAIGSAIGSVIPGLGTIIGAAIGAALAALVEWLSNLFDNPDDFIGAKSWRVRFPNAKQSTIEAMATNPLPTPKGVWAYPIQKMTMTGDGSHYELRLHWRAFA